MLRTLRRLLAISEKAGDLGQFECEQVKLFLPQPHHMELGQKSIWESQFPAHQQFWDEDTFCLPLHRGLHLICFKSAGFPSLRVLSLNAFPLSALSSLG